MEIVRKVVVPLFIVLVVGVAATSCVTRVDVGHVGVRVRLAGEARGIQNAPTVSGWVFYNPFTETIVEFPTSVQNFTWTNQEGEGGTYDESLTFASSEGVSINADVGLSFHIEPTLVPRLYGRFRQQDLSVLAHSYVRNVVREALSEVASSMPVQDIYGSGKTRLLHEAQRLVERQLGPDGFRIDQLSFLGSFRLPQNVQDAINRAMEATQNAIQAENRVRQTRAEADQAVAQAHGEAEAARQRAQGEADSILIRARAESQANEIIRLSTSAEVIAYRQLQRWNGQLPVVTGGGNVPMLTLDASQFLRIPEAERQARLRELLGATSPSAPAQPAAQPATPAPAPAQPATP